MSTPLADRIRKKAQEAASAPLATQTGASGAIANQVAVSSTGKASTTAAIPQSSVQETAVTAQSEAQKQGIAGSVQDAAADMAIDEQKSATTQASVESNQRTQKLQADTKFNNTLKEFASQEMMNKTADERERATIALKGELQKQRLGNEQYKQALLDAGRNSRLESKEDFVIALSDQGLNRGKLTTDELAEQTVMIEDYQRDTGAEVTMNDIDVALRKSQRDTEADLAAKKVGLGSTILKEGGSIAVKESGIFDKEDTTADKINKIQDNDGASKNSLLSSSSGTVLT